MPEGGDDISKVKDKWKRFKEMSMMQKVVIILPYAIVMCLCIRICELYRLSNHNIFTLISHLNYIVSHHIHTKPKDMILGSLIGFSITWFIKWDMKRKTKKTRPGVEHGAARWGTREDIAPFIAPDPFFNIILSATERLTMNPKMKIFKFNR